MRYEGSKTGIFEAFPETSGTKVRVATGQVRFHFPIPVLATFWVIFGFAATMLTLQGSVQTLKIVDFDPTYLKVQSPHFSEIFRQGLSRSYRGGGALYPSNYDFITHGRPGYSGHKAWVCPPGGGIA